MNSNRLTLFRWFIAVVCVVALSHCADSTMDTSEEGTEAYSSIEGEATSLLGLCGGPKGLQCPKSQYCKIRAGGCDTPAEYGKCTSFPQVCPLFLKPVCGCDGKTYGNECEMEMAGISKDYDGVCKNTCVDDSQCVKGSVCDPNSCNADSGLCTPVPSTCPRIFAPVCGCNGKTYGNDCLRLKAGTGLAYPGKCKCQSVTCPVGQDGIDTNGDGCADTCKAKCNDTCDCYKAGLSYSKPCPLLCASCDNYWTCGSDGYCHEGCGPVPLESLLCGNDCLQTGWCPDGYECVEETQCSCPPGVDPTMCDGPCFITGMCKKKEPGCCTSDADCLSPAAKLVCVEGVCEPAPGPGLCWDNGDCAQGSHCEGAITCPCGALCIVPSQPGKCIPDEPVCLSDADCPSGTHCELETICPCGTNPGSDPTCLAPCYLKGKCVPNLPPGCCKADSDCKTGMACVAGVCEPKPPMGQCWKDADCGEHYVCKGAITCPCGAQCFVASKPGVCEPKYPMCQPTGACPTGSTCTCVPPPGCPECDSCFFMCVPNPTKIGCYGDQDCPTGTKCNAGEICLPPPGCAPGMICPAVCYGYCVN